MPGPRSTGLPDQDAQNDFMRARRRAVASRLAARLRGEPDDVRMVLPYEEVVEALGYVSERRIGLRVVAYVTDVLTKGGAERTITLSDLPMRSLTRVFDERVPLPESARAEIRLTDPWDYARLSEHVEAWGFRSSQERHQSISRGEAAYQWLEHEYRPVVAMLREADLIGDRTETEAYLRVSAERYRLLRTHRWDDAVIERLIEAGGSHRRGRGRRS